MKDTYPPMKMEQTECSETSACKIQTPENYPEERIQHLEHGENLKSRIVSKNFPKEHCPPCLCNTGALCLLRGRK